MILYRLAAPKRSEDGTAAVPGRSNVTHQAMFFSSNAGTTSPSPIGGERARVHKEVVLRAHGEHSFDVFPQNYHFHKPLILLRLELQKNNLKIIVD